MMRDMILYPKTGREFNLEQGAIAQLNYAKIFEELMLYLTKLLLHLKIR